jgi:hypothetical protein
MKRRGPLLTLLAGLALAGVLFALSTTAARDSVKAPVAQQEAAPQEAEPPAEQPDDAADAQAGGQEDPQEGAPEEPADESAGAAPAGGAAGSAAAKRNVTWAGRVQGGKATIAIVARGDKAIAYVCDGRKLEAWLSGSAADGALELKGAKNATLTGSFGNGRAEGTIEAGGREFTFDVAAVKKPSGLYRAAAPVRGARLVGGWIVLADGTQVGLATLDGVTVTVPPLDLTSGTATVAGAEIMATSVAPGEPGS